MPGSIARLRTESGVSQVAKSNSIGKAREQPHAVRIMPERAPSKPLARLLLMRLRKAPLLPPQQSWGPPMLR